MAHEVLENGDVLVDWETGDTNGDRKTILMAYADFISEVIELSETDEKLKAIIDKWKVKVETTETGKRIWIERPEA